ncbi:MAG: PilZ domain-containing protein [Nitrospirota bacterium]
MLPEDNLRRHERMPFASNVAYSVTVMDFKQLENIRDTAISVDISDGGLGMITGYPLEKGHVLTFIDMIKTKNINPKVAIVKWIWKIDNKYRVGVKFV